MKRERHINPDSSQRRSKILTWYQLITGEVLDYYTMFSPVIKEYNPDNKSKIVAIWTMSWDNYVNAISK